MLALQRLMVNQCIKQQHKQCAAGLPIN